VLNDCSELVYPNEESADMIDVVVTDVLIIPGVIAGTIVFPEPE
jgi:hypothetical protein